jgi:hypothetical protein
MPLAWPPERVHLYTVYCDHSWSVRVCIKVASDTVTRSWIGIRLEDSVRCLGREPYMSVISFHKIVVHVAVGRVGRNGLAQV